jgi:fructose-1,6-bisphosphatase II
MGVARVPERLIAACALRATDGAIVARLSPQSEEERAGALDAGLDLERILVTEEIVTTDQVFFAATGITDGALLSGVQYRGRRAESSSLVMRGQTRTRRLIQTEHLLAEETEAWRRYVPGEPFRYPSPS